MSPPSSVKMPTPTVALQPLRSFRALSFDIYATLIDWEASIPRQLEPLTARLSADHELRRSSAEEQKSQLCRLFNEIEREIIEKNPGVRYDAALEETYVRVAKHLGVENRTDEKTLRREAEEFGAGIGEWQAFPDTVAAMQRLKRHYRLIVLSNVDRASFAKTLAGPLKGVDFDAIYVAEEIGTYKPDLNNFHYLLKHAKQDLGVEKEEILHTAQALGADHVPAKLMEMSSAWIDRTGSAMGGTREVQELVANGKVGFGWRFETLASMADAVDAE